jgi:hypothetical protein
MGVSKNITIPEKPLIRRYLIWCYKTTREELEKTERKFTQLKVDRFLLSSLPDPSSKKILEGGRKAFAQRVIEFQEYIVKKEKDAIEQKYADRKAGLLTTEYQYLRLRFLGIEKAIVRFLGSKELKNIELLYEQEMIRRILVASDH